MAVNSAGTLVGAILESVGYHYQSALLNTLTDPLTDEIGALIYVFGIALAVLMTATQGQYKMGVWLLIGPPLFFATIIPRGDIDNASWRFGRQARDDAAVDRGKQQTIKAAGQADGKKAKVSKLFATFVNMVSVTQQEMVHTITKNRREADLALVVRAELFSKIHISQFNKPGLERLFHRAMLGECYEALEYARAMHDPLYRPAKFGNPRREIIDGNPNGEAAKEFYSNRKEYFRNKFEKAAEKQQNLDGEMAVLVASSQVKGGGDEFLKQVEQNQVVPLNCYQIWKLTLHYIKQQAGQDLDKILSRGAQLGVSRESVLNIIAQAHGIKRDTTISSDSTENVFDKNDLLALNRIMAKYLIRNESRRDSWGSRLAYWITNMETQDVRMRFPGKEGSTELARTAAQEWSEKERMINAAASLPYYQGLGLFLMSAVFPFFALLLLIPGKQAGFFLWFMIWIWLKSWDVAMAVVMILDDVVFSMLSVQMQNRGVGVQGQNELETFGLAFATINEMDPTFQLSTYYTIMATAILAIPPTTAHVIMGGLKGGAGLVSAGINRNSMQASNQFLGAVEQSAVNAIRNDFNDFKEQRKEQNFLNARAGDPVQAGLRDSFGRKVNPQDQSPIRTNAYRNGAFHGRPLLPNQITKRAALAARSPASGELVSGPVGSELAARQQRNMQGQIEGGGAKGFNKPMRAAGDIKNPALLSIWAKAATARGRSFAPVYDANNHTLDAEYGAVAEQAVWEAEMDPEQLKRVHDMGIMGSLTIPSPNFASSYAGAETHETFLFKRFEEQMEQERAKVGYIGEMASTARQTLAYVINSAYDQKRGDGEGLMGLGNIDKATAKAIQNDYDQLNKARGGNNQRITNITSEETRKLDERTKSFVWQKLNTQSSAFQNVGTIMAGSQLYSTTWMKQVGGELYSPEFGYGDQKDANDVGDPSDMLRRRRTQKPPSSANK